jgi:ketosteroid isomerase-like protein
VRTGAQPEARLGDILNTVAREVTPKRLSLPAGTKSNRTFDERVFARFPSMLPRLISAVMRLSPGSRIRQAFLSRLVRGGWAASDRGDFDLCLCGIDPDVEIIWPQGGRWAFPDLRGNHHGHDGWRRAWRALHEPFDVAIRVEEIIDAGDRLVTIADATVLGTGSGVRVSGPLIVLHTFRAGRIVREQYFNEREEALEAAGIRPEDLRNDASP